MANETLIVEGTPKTIEPGTSSLAIPSGTVGSAASLTYNRTTDGGDYPDVKFVLTCGFASAPSVLRSIAILLRPLNIDGTNDAPVPSATYPRKRGAALACSAGSSQSLEGIARDVPSEFEAYVYNVDTGQQINAGWKLIATPVSYKPAP